MRFVEMLVFYGKSIRQKDNYVCLRRRVISFQLLSRTSVCDTRRGTGEAARFVPMNKYNQLDLLLACVCVYVSV